MEKQKQNMHDQAGLELVTRKSLSEIVFIFSALSMLHRIIRVKAPFIMLNTQKLRLLDLEPRKDTITLETWCVCFPSARVMRATQETDYI